jgi:hypothetical protein
VGVDSEGVWFQVDGLEWVQLVQPIAHPPGT